MVLKKAVHIEMQATVTMHSLNVKYLTAMEAFTTTTEIIKTSTSKANALNVPLNIWRNTASSRMLFIMSRFDSVVSRDVVDWSLNKQNRRRMLSEKLDNGISGLTHLILLSIATMVVQQTSVVAKMRKPAPVLNPYT